jgi:hypothetical protein
MNKSILLVAMLFSGGNLLAADCQKLFELTFPAQNDRNLWIAGYDGNLPSDWAAYKSAEKQNCHWYRQRMLGRPCKDYYEASCSTKPFKPAVD